MTAARTDIVFEAVDERGAARKRILNGALACVCRKLRPLDLVIRSLIGLSGNSLFLAKFSLMRLCKIPVPLRREFDWKLLN
jgi:hypothetical protein